MTQLFLCDKKLIRPQVMGFPDDFLRIMQRAVAVTAIGPSSLRNQGASGVIVAARDFLSVLDLSLFDIGINRKFLLQLDRTTNRLILSLPKNAQNWGAARKAVNLFLRDAFYNTYLASKYKLPRIESSLEIPLDSAVAKDLKKLDKFGEIPAWPGLKRLTPTISSQFQSFAEKIARKRGLARVHLDIYLWLEER